MANIDQILLLLNLLEHKLNLSILSETWLNIDINFFVKGYSIINSLCIND